MLLIRITRIDYLAYNMTAKSHDGCRGFKLSFEYESKHCFNHYCYNSFNSAYRLFVPQYPDCKPSFGRRNALDLRLYLL
jgi:hypothetical protein